MLVDRIVKAVVGSKFDRDMREIAPVVRRINSLEPQMVKTDEELARSRKKRLKKRMKKETPLFAEHFENVELGRNPSYYEGKSRYEAERQEVLRREQEEYEYLAEHPFEVLVTACNRA